WNSPSLIRTEVWYTSVMPWQTTHHPLPSAVASTWPNPPFLSTFSAAGIDTSSGAKARMFALLQMSLPPAGCLRFAMTDPCGFAATPGKPGANCETVPATGLPTRPAFGHTGAHHLPLCNERYPGTDETARVRVGVRGRFLRREGGRADHLGRPGR